MRLTLMIFSLGGGGAQRVISNMANYWAANGRAVTLVTYGDVSARDSYGLHPAVEWRPLSIARESRNRFEAIAFNLIRLVIIRRAIAKTEPDAVISFLDKVNVRTIISCLGTQFPVVVSERVDPAEHSIGLGWNLLRSFSYRYAARVVTQTERALGFFSGEIRRKGRVIPNPLLIQERYLGLRHQSRTKVVIAMGRLVHQKGFDLLLRAFSVVARKYPEWRLVVWGEGDLRMELENLRDELGLQGRATFRGWTDDPFGEMRRAELFVLSSRYEGFPNALCEAMGCGLPVISFDCPSGPNQIIRDGVDGILVAPNDVDALATAMDRVIEDHSFRSSLGVRASAAIRRLDLKGIMGKWEAVLCEAIDSRH